MLAALLLAPVAELAVAIEVGRATGAPVVLGVLLLGAVAGALLIRRQGLVAWRSLQHSARSGEPLSPDLAKAVVKVSAGVLLLAPGLVSDVVALLLLFPPTRSLARRPLERMLLRLSADRAAHRGGGDVVTGEVFD